jgi:hypothetical protein
VDEGGAGGGGVAGGALGGGAAVGGVDTPGGVDGGATSVDSTTTFVPLTATMRTWVPAAMAVPSCEVAPQTSP